jgi:two-component system, OmpR family, sensor kinase
VNPLLCFIRARLRRRLFLWFGATILLTGLAVSAVLGAGGGDGPATWHRDLDRVRTFLAGRFERVWDDPGARDELAVAMTNELDTTVTIEDEGGRKLASFGPPCRGRPVSAPVVRGGRTLGRVSVCADRYRTQPWRAFVPLIVTGMMIWGASGAIARRLSRPLVELSRVAVDLGEGRFGSRVRLGRHQHGEVAIVAMAVNQMAERIQRHLAEQRQLLASVSHELRTPLSRIRLLTEIERDRLSGGDPATIKMLDELDREVMEIDALVGDLLASSRIEFAVHAPRPLDAAETAARALERAGVDPSVLVVEAADTNVEADPTLLARALANLIDNAGKHGGGLRVLRIKETPGHLAIEAEDAGAGFPPGEETRVFEPFYRRVAAGEDGAADQGSLGLGLALVKRIAGVHGGRVYAENRAGGGARVGIELPIIAVPAGV